MGRGKRNPAGHRGGDACDWLSARGNDDRLWDPKNPEDDPLHDLRPHDEDLTDPVIDEYVWPDMSDENEEDD